MYRIKVKDITLTKRLASIEQAEEVKQELLEHYFTDFSKDELVIVDDDGNPVV
jgi:hypothetical protein